MCEFVVDGAGVCQDKRLWTAGVRKPRNIKFEWYLSLYDRCPMDYTWWARSEPNNGLPYEENCVEIVDVDELSSPMYLWKDAKCREELCFVCEINSRYC